MADGAAAAVVNEQCRVLFGFGGDGPNQLTISPGEVIDVQYKIDTEWWQGELNGRVGFFPAAYVEVIHADAPVAAAAAAAAVSPGAQQPLRARVKVAYSEKGDGRLALDAGEEVAVLELHTASEEWCFVEHDGSPGFFPREFLELLEPDAGPAAAQSATGSAVAAPVSAPPVRVQSCRDLATVLVAGMRSQWEMGTAELRDLKAKEARWRALCEGSATAASTIPQEDPAEKKRLRDSVDILAQSVVALRTQGQQQVQLLRQLESQLAQEEAGRARLEQQAVTNEERIRAFEADQEQWLSCLRQRSDDEAAQANQLRELVQRMAPAVALLATRDDDLQNAIMDAMSKRERLAEDLYCQRHHIADSLGPGSAQAAERLTAARATLDALATESAIRAAALEKPAPAPAPAQAHAVARSAQEQEQALQAVDAQYKAKCAEVAATRAKCQPPAAVVK
eukprot:TRINITY_DN33_c0_g2_i1.p1 TRINITY_DN33_c0_g2~~TRINITY_DN33_c0_g2_i1.p1  ORF type:complete len:467 (-),score=147.07 TRINITY_DN33_c0_g2_i1:32-1387(-)